MLLSYICTSIDELAAIVWVEHIERNPKETNRDQSFGQLPSAIQYTKSVTASTRKRRAIIPQDMERDARTVVDPAACALVAKLKVDGRYNQ